MISLHISIDSCLLFTYTALCTNNIYFCLNQILKSGSFFFFQNRETNHQRLQILRKKTLLTKIFICSERRGKDLGEEKRLLQCVM